MEMRSLVSMFRWSHVLTVWCIYGVMYASRHTAGSISTLLKALSCGFVAFLVMDLIGSYAVYRLQKMNPKDIPDDIKMNLISDRLDKVLKRAVKLSRKYGKDDERTIFAFAEATALTQQYKELVTAYGEKIHQEVQKLNIK